MRTPDIDAVLVEEPPSPPDQGLPPSTPRQLPPLKEILSRVVSRLRVLLAKWLPVIKSRPWIAWCAGLGLVMVVSFGAGYLQRSGRTAAPASPRVTPIEKLENLARDAFKRGRYVLPIDSSALAYSKRALRLDPSNNYSKAMIENSVDGGKEQVQQALKRKDFIQAHRLVNAMAQLLPGRKDIAQLNQDIRAAEGGGGSGPAPRKKAAQKVSFRAYHLHSGKVPADRGPYCLGVLSVSGRRFTFAGQSASQGQKVHKFDYACSDIREIAKNTRVAARQGGLRIRTASATLNFMPRDSSPTHLTAVAAACSN